MTRKAQRILLADDDPIYREVASEALEKAGHIITQANDGGQAIERLAAQAFDAAIVDLSMPVADGLTVIAALRCGTLNAHIPVIVITGHDDAAAVEKAYEAGATSFLTKPLNWVLFTPHVEFVLRSGQIESELRQASAAAAFLSDLKSQMMTALAREFQTPIKTILGFSELMNKEVHGPLTPPAYREMTRDISKSAHNLNAALLKLMDFGRTLTEQLKINDVAVNAREAVLDALAALETKAERRDIALKADIALPAGLMIQADPALLSQALRSMLDNAIRLSPRGESVELYAGVEADGRLSILTRDRGPSVPEDLIAEINGARIAPKGFTQNTESRDVSIKIAKVLAEAHQGLMNVTSEFKGQNVVRLELPRERVLNAGRVAAASPAPDLQKRFAAIGEALALDPRLRTTRDMPPASATRPLRDAPALTNVTGLIQGPQR